VSVATHGVLGHPGPWTMADVEALPDAGDHARYELLSPGVLTVSPAPGTAHQRASRLLANLLDDAANRSGADVEVLEAVNVEVPGGRLTTPDIAVVDGRVADTDPVRYPSSVVRLVVEIVSPGSRATDRAIKPELYAEAGIPAYWRLELQPAPHLITYILDGEHYAAAITLHAGQLGELPAPFPLHLDPADLARRRGPEGH
jgi:Uma2 family endonuclease